ncbi:uncharacterized protein BDV17DRAFT_301526 [Aspergillus undulatus]|uniref:uncharacterized protein n=1 Tax=Aspergillus undulatus TaxID=1810928 RepID=UPI003CCD8BCB
MFTTASTLFLALLAATNTLAAPASTSTLQKRVDLSCTDNGGGYRPVSEAQNCVDYLFNKGTDECTIENENGIFCQAGDTVITGSNIGGSGGATSLCRDVAYGAQAIIDSCTTSEGYVGGFNAAGGNGDLIISINHR